MVERYLMPNPDDTSDSPHARDFVFASDYDALAAELAEFKEANQQWVVQCEGYGATIQQLSAANARIAALTAALSAIQQWDMLNPLNGNYVFCDGPWLKRLVDSALSEQTNREAKS